MPLHNKNHQFITWCHSLTHVALQGVKNDVAVFTSVPRPRSKKRRPFHILKKPLFVAIMSGILVFFVGDSWYTHSVCESPTRKEDALTEERYRETTIKNAFLWYSRKKLEPFKNKETVFRLK